MSFLDIDIGMAEITTGAVPSLVIYALQEENTASILLENGDVLEIEY